MWTATTLVLASVATLVAWQLAPRWTTAASSPEATAPPLPVNVMPVEYVESIEQQRSYTGLIRPQLESQLAFELSGVILSVEVDDGDHVAPGDLIATLDTKILEAQAAAVTAQLSQAKEVLNELEAGPRAEQIAAAQAALDAATATAKNAETRRQRREKLVAQGALSPEEFDQATFDAQAALAQQEAAAQRLAELKAGTRPEKKAAQRALIQQLEASKKEIEVALEKTAVQVGAAVVGREDDARVRARLRAHVPEA